MARSSRCPPDRAVPEVICAARARPKFLGLAFPRAASIFGRVKAVEYLSRKSRATLLAAGLLVVAYLGGMDYATGTTALTLFYLIPICFVAWFAGRVSGVIAALASASAWYFVKHLPPSVVDNEAKLFWSYVQRFGTYLATGLLTAELAERKRVEEALRKAHEGLEVRVQARTVELGLANASLRSEVEERRRAEAKLQQLNETLEERVARRSADAEQRAAALARSENALRRQSGILQSVLNSMGDGVLVADARGDILLYNPAAERFMLAALGKVSPPDWLARFEAVFQEAPPAHARDAHPLLRAIRGEVVTGMEFFMRGAADGEGLWFSATGRPLVDEAARVQGGVLVLSDITPRKMMEKQIAEISEREQRRIGQDLHDGLCQHLVSVAFAGELLRKDLERRNLGEAAQAEAIVEMVNEGISEARHLARGLYPVRLEVDGLASALEELVAGTEARSGITCRFSCQEPVCIFDAVAGTNLYRIAQEAVNNAVKHSGCRTISVGLEAVDDEVTLTVRDDGTGLPELAESRTGMGLFIMQHRAKMIGAALETRRGAGGGAIIICSFHNENEVEKEHVHTSAN